MTNFKHRENWFAKIFLGSIFSVIAIFLLDCKFVILPINGVFLFFYVVIILTVSVWITSGLLQNLLKENRPIDYSTVNSKYINILQRVIGRFYNFNSNSKNTDILLDTTSVHGGKQGNTLSVGDAHLKKRLSTVNEDEVDVEVFENPSYLTKEVNQYTIDDRISDFVQDVETRFLKNWYGHISEDNCFIFESEKLLDEIVRRFLQVVVQIDHKKLTHTIFVVFLRHIKEFKKSVKRSEKNGMSVEECFRYSHIGSKSNEAFQHFVHQLTTKILRQFISSELWNSLLWRTLVSILSKKLTTHILKYVSQPGFINYRIISNCATDQEKIHLNFEKKAYISLSDVNLSIKNEKSPKIVEKKTLLDSKREELTFDTVDGSKTPKLSPKKALDIQQPLENAGSVLSAIEEDGKPKESDADKVDSVKNSRAVSEPVKIYESSSHKTWRNSSDLECISLGEDLLALQEFVDPDSQIQNLIEKKLWKDNSDSTESEDKGQQQHSIWNIHEVWFGEEEPAEIHKDAITPSSNMHTTASQLITNTMKPIGHVTANTLQNMKEFQQSTVNTVNSVVKPISQATSSAKHRIGDLQDEAAGVMEGIFDFGMAGLRKGLRLTGLQDNISDLTQKSKQEIHKFQKSLDAKASDVLKNIETAHLKYETSKVDPKPHKIRKLTKLSHINSDEANKIEDHTSSNESDDNVWVNPLNNNKESPCFEGQILLEKTPLTPKSFVQDVSKKLNKEESKFQEIPQIAMEANSTHNSPDLEYEDTTDLATTTAKLRSLLQQRSSESNMTTPALSPMPQDENLKITTPMEPAELSDVDGVMPSLYKFYNKTATGLQNTFNTIKTALPGTEKTPEAITVDNTDAWKYEFLDANENDFQSRMQKLLHERRDFCTIDPAYDYLEIMDQTDGLCPKSETTFDDELDEFDVQIPVTKAAMDIFCELISNTKSPLTQEPVVKAILLLCGRKSEDHINNYTLQLIKNIKNYVGKLPQNQNDLPLAMKLPKFIEILLNKIPEYLKEIIGYDTLFEGMDVLIKSLQSQKINLDLTLQIFEIVAAQLIQANNLMSPAYSA